MKRILIVEDDKEINELLCKILIENNYEAQSAFSGMDGINLLRSDNYDMVLLDIMLPFKSGDEILRELRTFSNVPVIIITAKDLTQTKVDLLRLGADDYITKPFDMDEVLARIEAAIRRYHPETNEQGQSGVLFYAGVTLDMDAKEARVNNEILALTAKEYKILELMMSYPQKVYSKANLFKSVWGEEYFGDENTVNVHISNLRTKLKAVDPTNEYIETVWGLGYRLYKKV